MRIDARGKACPMPVMLVKKEIDIGQKDISILVDNQTAVINLKHLAKRNGFEVVVTDSDGCYLVSLRASGSPESPGHYIENEESLMYPTLNYTDQRCVYWIAKDHLGEGDLELGSTLMKMFLYTLAESEQVPEALLFINGGVKIPTADEGEQVIDSLKSLADRGCEVLVCGACLNFYGLTDQLKVGDVSNMYDLVERLRSSDKVVSL